MSDKSSSNITNLWPIIVVAAIISSALIFALIAFYGVNVPFGDQWELVSYFEKGLNDDLTLLDFWSPHNEHITPFSLFIQYHLAELSGWNTKYEMFVSLSLALLNYFILMFLLRNTITSIIDFSKIEFKATIAIYSIVIIVFLIAFEFFSINQLENWLWGWQIQWFVHVMGVLLVFSSLGFTLEGKKAVHTFAVVTAFLGGILATFSLAQGILIWIIAIPMFFLAKRLRKYLIPWLGCFIISVLMYQSNNGHTLSIFQRLEKLDFMEFLRFILVFLGGAINQGEAVGTILLTLSVLAVVVALILYKHSLNIVMPWILLGTYIVTASVIISIGRSHLGSYMGGSSRYASLSNLAFISLIVLLFCIFARFRYRQFLINSLLLTGLLLIIFSWYQSFPGVKGYHSHTSYIRNCLDNYQSINEACLQHVYPNRTLLSEKLSVLEQLGYAKISANSGNQNTASLQDIATPTQIIGVGKPLAIKGDAIKSGVFHSNDSALSQKDRNAYGTWADSDANTGSIDWTLQTDEPITSFESIVLEYKTGPNLENLYIQIIDNKETIVYNFRLEKATSWTEAEINIADIDLDGEGLLSLKIIDNGSEWGQWLAIQEPKLIRY